MSDHRMLTISPLSLGYAGNAILQFKGMHLRAGDDCLITGPSGCGKTTLLYAIAGLLLPLSGHIEINGTDITTLSESKRDQFRGKHIGIIFQTLHLVKSLSVLDNLLMATYIAGLPSTREAAEKSLKHLGIDHKMHDFPASLSQGQQQRVAIARAIMHQPSLILADEPTSSLDDTATENVIALLKQVAENCRATLIISTHDSRVKKHFSNVRLLTEAA